MAFCNGLQVRRTLGYHEGRAARLQSTQDIIEYQIVARFIINQLLENILNGRSRSAQCGLMLEAGIPDKMARRGRRRWAILLRRGAMMRQPLTREPLSNTRSPTI